jgi:PAS domain S-box-containing protein
MKWTDIVVEEDIEKMKKTFIQALKTDRSYVREYRIGTSTGEILWVQEGSQIICNEEGEIEFISGAFLDITDRLLIDTLPNVVFKGYKDGSVDFIDNKIEQLTGYKKEDFNSRHMNLTDIVVKEDAEKMQKYFTEALKTKKSYVREFSIRIKTGEILWLQEGSQIVCNEEGEVEFISGAFLNITKRKRAEEALQKAHNELKRLSGRIMVSQEQERTAIARELHDELGQVLTALRMDSMWMASRLNQRDPKAAERALTMCDLILKTIADVKGMALRLRPKVLDDLGLIAALDWYTDDFEKRTGIPCIFEHPDVVDLDDIAATAAYRIAQEALTNVIRHSLATHVEVTLQSDEGMLTLAVTDNGRGFNMMKLSESEGLGLAGMRERASLSGGTLEIQSHRAKGTQVYLRLPFDGKRGAL